MAQSCLRAGVEAIRRGFAAGRRLTSHRFSEKLTPQPTARCTASLPTPEYEEGRPQPSNGATWTWIKGVTSIVETAQHIIGQRIVFQSTKNAAGRRGVAIGAATVAMLREHQGRQLLHQVEL